MMRQTFVSIKVDMNEFGKKIKKADRLFSNVDAPQEALLDAKVFKQIARISKNFIGQLSTNEAKFSNNVSQFQFDFGFWNH